MATNEHTISEHLLPQSTDNEDRPTNTLLVRLMVLSMCAAAAVLAVCFFSGHDEPTTTPQSTQSKFFFWVGPGVVPQKPQTPPPTVPQQGPGQVPTYTQPKPPRRAEVRMRDNLDSSDVIDVTSAPRPPPAEEGCDLDNMDKCPVADLETLYVDALYSFYADGKKLLTDDQFDQLKSELVWQGSGFPVLRRQEVTFVKAAVAHARGESILTDEQWQNMKEEMRASGKRNKDVTAFLMRIKPVLELSPADREKLEQQLCEAGVTISPLGIECLLSDSPTNLRNNVGDVVQMYGALGLVPSTVCFGAWAIVALIAGGPNALFDTAVFGIPAATGVSWFATSQLIKYVELTRPQMLTGTCPCCESEVRQLAVDSQYSSPKVTCGNCKSSMSFNTDEMVIEQLEGMTQVGAPTQSPWLNSALNQAALFGLETAVGSKPEDSQLGTPEKSSASTQVDTKNVWEHSLSHVTDGIFAWAVLIGYAIFGEQFVGRVRGKGIALHSQTINEFCKEFAIPNSLRQKYIQTAKRNGHDLGFLVEGKGLFGDGVFGEPALKWWKSTGW